MAEPHPRAGEADQLLGSALLQETLSQIEAEAMERAVDARSDDDETRRSALCEVRAIRSVRGQLEAILKPLTKAPRTGSPV
jgi:hypothetical protein